MLCCHTGTIFPRERVLAKKSLYTWTASDHPDNRGEGGLYQKFLARGYARGMGTPP